MKKKRDRRWRFWADKTIQGRLAIRLAFYWFACQFAMVATIVGMSILMQGSTSTGVGSIWSLIVPAVIVSIMVMPFAMYDLIAFSNRFTGPIMRFRRQFARLAESGTTDEIHFRPADFYHDLSENFNRIRSKPDPSEELKKPAPTDKDLRLPTLQITSPVGSENHV
jgi:hypothetical protein